ncbi:hypothetical protein QP948_08175 [Corynebacterium bovis]|uniref:hypothetical protein n=1 Tax=Corynebacterium bovis TaxID=36808 RepID=UPI00254E8E11|nr:hypothetical protein [Corynebacterium bovis]MDK8511368.1 hypothetical protein [Corynebacterium bovis]
MGADRAAGTTGRAQQAEDIPVAAPSGDVQEGVAPLTPEGQLTQLVQFMEDSYPEMWEAVAAGPGEGDDAAARTDRVERLWARLPDLLSHSSQLVLGAGLDHSMPGVAFTRTGPEPTPFAVPGTQVTGTVLTPSGVPTPRTGAVAVALHGGPGWFGDGASHDQLWLPLFAALAEQSGVTVIDLVHPLPVPPAAVARAVAAVRDRFPDAPGVGAVVFGSGMRALREVEVDWLVAFSPRVGDDGPLPPGTAGTPVFLSAADADTTGTPPDVASRVFHDAGAQVEERHYVSDHLVAPPAEWRRRVLDAARWMATRPSPGVHRGPLV